MGTLITEQLARQSLNTEERLKVESECTCGFGLVAGSSYAHTTCFHSSGECANGGRNTSPRKSKKEKKYRYKSNNKN